MYPLSYLQSPISPNGLPTPVIVALWKICRNLWSLLLFTIRSTQNSTYIFIFAYKIFPTENQFLGPTNFAGDVWQQCDGGMPPVWKQRWRGSRLSTLMCHCHAAIRDLMVLPGEVLAAFVFVDETPESWDIIQHCRPWHGTPGQEAKDATRTWGTMLLSTVQSWNVL